MLFGIPPAPGTFEYPKKGRSEAYGPGTVSEETWTIGPRFANNGRTVAIEAAMIPRFCSSLSFFQPHEIS